MEGHIDTKQWPDFSVLKLPCDVKDSALASGQRVYEGCVEAVTLEVGHEKGVVFVEGG